MEVKVTNDGRILQRISPIIVLGSAWWCLYPVTFAILVSKVS